MHSLSLPVDRLEHGWAGQLEPGWAGQLEHWLSWPAWTWLLTGLFMNVGTDCSWLDEWTHLNNVVGTIVINEQPCNSLWYFYACRRWKLSIWLGFLNGSWTETGLVPRILDFPAVIKPDSKYSNQNTHFHYIFTLHAWYTLTVSSADPLTSCIPSGEKSTVWTQLLWPWYALRRSFVLTSHSYIEN